MNNEVVFPRLVEHEYDERVESCKQTILVSSVLDWNCSLQGRLVREIFAFKKSPALVSIARCVVPVQYQESRIRKWSAPLKRSAGKENKSLFSQRGFEPMPFSTVVELSRHEPQGDWCRAESFARFICYNIHVGLKLNVL